MRLSGAIQGVCECPARLLLALGCQLGHGSKFDSYLGYFSRDADILEEAAPEPDQLPALIRFPA